MKNTLILLFALSCCLICACASNPSTQGYNEIKASDNSLAFVSSERDCTQLYEILSQNPSLNELHDTVSLDFIKQTSTGCYTVFKTDKGLLKVVFCKNGEFSYSELIRFTQGISKDKLGNIPIGTSLWDIKEADPNGNYAFLYAGTAAVDPISLHYYEDGTYYAIYYDKSYCVICVEKHLL